MAVPPRGSIYPSPPNVEDIDLTAPAWVVAQFNAEMPPGSVIDFKVDGRVATVVVRYQNQDFRQSFAIAPSMVNTQNEINRKWHEIADQAPIWASQVGLHHDSTVLPYVPTNALPTSAADAPTSFSVSVTASTDPSNLPGDGAKNA